MNSELSFLLEGDVSAGVAGDVQGTWQWSAVRRAIGALEYDNIQGFRQALGLNSCDWLCDWAVQNPQAVIAWLRAGFGFG